MAQAKKNKQPKNVKQKSVDTAMKIVRGNVLSSEFFKRHWLQVFVLIIMILVFITNKYQCQTRMEVIRKLERELEVVKTERIRERSAYMSNIRETAMRERIDSLHLGLSIQERPPFQLDYDEGE